MRQQTIGLVQAMNSAKAGSSKDARYMISMWLALSCRRALPIATQLGRKEAGRACSSSKRYRTAWNLAGSSSTPLEVSPWSPSLYPQLIASSCHVDRLICSVCLSRPITNLPPAHHRLQSACESPHGKRAKACSDQDRDVDLTW